jgi:hypothetical protein
MAASALTAPLAIALAAALAACLASELLAGQGDGLVFPPVKVTWTFTARHASCPDKDVFTGSLSFPRQTGGEETDRRLEALAEEWLAGVQSGILEDLAELQDPCSSERELQLSIDYELFRPSPSFLGALFTDRGYGGGTRGWIGFDSYTFELATGRLLGVADLFPDREKGLAGLYSYVWGRVCGQDPPRESLPRFFGGAPCGGKSAPAPPQGFLAEAETLDDLGGLVLTPEGAGIHIDPSSAWSWAEGPFSLVIPKEELVGMGADPALWGER